MRLLLLAGWVLSLCMPLQAWACWEQAAQRYGVAADLLYAIARVLARNHINLQLAKISTLGERVEDTFLVDGPVPVVQVVPSIPVESMCP